MEMFLNDIGQPLILDPNKKYSPFEQVSNACELFWLDVYAHFVAL